MTHLTLAKPAALEGEVLGAGDCVRVIGLPHAFATARIDTMLPSGLSIEDLLREALGHVPLAAHVSVGMVGEHGWREEEVERRHWRHVRPRPGATLSFRVLPLGGGNMLRTLLMLAVVLAVAFFAPYLAGILAPGLTGAGLTLLTGVIGTVLTTAANMLLNALFPVKPPKLSSGDSGDATQSIAGARNQADPWGPVPVVFGRHRVYPKYAANPYTEIIGDDQFLRLLFCVGYGPLAVSDLKIGSTPATDFEGVEIEIRQGYEADADPTLYPDQVFESTFDILLTHPEGAETGPDGPWFTRTTADNVSELVVDIAAPRGLFKTDSDGKRQNRGVSYRIEYSVAGADDWHNITVDGAVDGVIHQDRSSMQPLRWGHRWTVTAGQYDVRVKRWSNDERQPRLTDEIRWTALRGFRHAPPVNSERPLCLIAMRVQASNQLNGTIDTFNCIASSILPDWDAAASPPSWVARETRNPASMFRAVLQGPANARPVSDEEIDLEQLQAWHAQCDDEGWRFDQSREFTASALDALTDLASAGRAAVTLRDARWGVMLNDPEAPIVSHFSPRNSRDFQSERAYREFPHAWRVRFVNEDIDWQNDERIIYDTGYSEANATRFEGLEFPGVTSPDNIWRHGRFHLAQARLRPETYSFLTDFENLIVTRGDRIRFSHDVALFGLGSGRVKSIDGLVVELDDIVGMEPTKSYCMRFRAKNGDSLFFNIVTDPGERRSVTLVDPGTSPLVLPEGGDEDGELYLFGEVGSESVDLAVLAIEPAADLGARIVCVDWAPEISTADTGEIPEFDSQVSPPIDLRTRLPPTDLRFSEGLVRAGPVVQSIASLSWQRPAVSGPLPQYEVQYRQTTGEWSTGIVVQQTLHQFIDLDGASYDFRVRTLGPDNSASSWAVIAAQSIEGLLAPPAKVASFRIQIVGALATLSWARNDDLDLSHYEVRHVASGSTALWQNGLVLAENISGTSLQVPALGGTYLIKAVDTSGVYSEEAALIISSVDSIAGLNAVEIIDEAAPSPIFPGLGNPASTNVRLDDLIAGIRIDDVDQAIDDDNPFIEGIYAFAENFDLGAVYTSRLTVTAEVQGFDTEENFLALEDVLATDDILGGEIDDYEVSVQARWTSDDPLSSPVAWSDWTPLVVADVTARAFEFRAVLHALRRHITPVVTQLAVQIDMPDRIASAEDVTVANTGMSVSFTPAFRATPAVVITIQDAATGDYAEITSKDAAGFDVIVKNSGGSGVERVIDWHAQGYGELAA